MQRIAICAICLVLLLSMVGINSHALSISTDKTREATTSSEQIDNRMLGNIISNILFFAPLLWLLVKKRRSLKGIFKVLSQFNESSQLPDAPSPHSDNKVPVSAYALHESPFDTPNAH